MSDIVEYLNQDGFLKTLFNSMPCGVLVIDPDRRVLAANNVLERTFEQSSAELVKKRGGEALKCIHSYEDPRGCGYSETCRSCTVKQTAEAAFSGRNIHRRRVEVELKTPAGKANHVMLITAAPLKFREQNLAVIILEDITELARLRMRFKAENSFAGIIGGDAKMQELFATIRELADSNVTVLIQGESGTGKELVAAAIHNEGSRANKLFVPVNCSALPEGLLESELFGHVKGAFTGAVRDKKGRFELADGGTILLDEVAELPMPLQAKLLRVLQEGAFERVGAESQTKIDTRVISATNRDLGKEVAEGRFREDLYYRLAVVPITIPPLRERKSDIPMLVDHIIKEVCRDTGHNVKIAPETMAMMMDYHWPGNVRELQNAIQYAVVKSRGELIAPQHIPPNIALSVEGKSSSSQISSPRRQTKKRKKLNADSVRQALTDTNWNKKKAAQRLGVGRATLYRFLNDNPID